MTIASYQTLKRLKPIADMQERTTFGGMTYGLGPAGYDIRIAESVILAPGKFRLASAMELFNIPPNLLGIVHDKSTWARKGLALQNTVAEPGWRGYLTLELSNHGTQRLRINKGAPIAQVIFHLLDMPTRQPYSGRYQDQLAGPQRATLLADDNGRSCHAGVTSERNCIVCRGD